MFGFACFFKGLFGWAFGEFRVQSLGLCLGLGASAFFMGLRLRARAFMGLGVRVQALGALNPINPKLLGYLGFRV